MVQDNKYKRTRNKRQEWEVLTLEVRGDAGVEVSILPLPIPRYSFRVGTAHFPEVAGDAIKISSRLTNFNARDAADLLDELEEKYSQLREDAIEKAEEKKRRAVAAQRRPDVTLRRPRSED